MVAYAEDIAVWIFEPGYPIAVGCGPDAEDFILSEGKYFERDAALREPLGRRLNVCDFPAQNGAVKRSELWDLRDSDPVAADGQRPRQIGRG